MLSNLPRTHVLGYSQPSLRDWSVLSYPTQDSRVYVRTGEKEPYEGHGLSRAEKAMLSDRL
jgi:hypothetical protein